MSLQVWLPLINDYENQGLSSLKFTPVSSNTYNQSNGKIGVNCFYNNSHTNSGVLSNSKLKALGSNVSMFAWIKLDGFGTNPIGIGGTHSILGSGYSTATGMGINVIQNPANTSVWVVSVNTGDGSVGRTWQNYYGSTSISAGVWYHVGFTYDGTYIKIYVNGKLDVTHTYTGQSNPADYVHVFSWAQDGTVGTPNVFPHYNPVGSINDFRIYDHTLSTKEVRELSKGLVAHYKLTDSMIASDSSGYNNRLTQVGTVNVIAKSPRYKSCVDYNNTGYLKSDSFGLKTQEFTVSFWMNPPTSINAQHFLFGTHNVWTGNGFSGWRDLSGTSYNTLIKSDAESSHSGITFYPTANTWNHIVYVYTGTELIYYKDGVEQSRITYGSNGIVQHPVIYLGNSTYSNAPTSEIDEACMSDFRFYATALSANDIAELYSTPVSLTKAGKLFAYEFVEDSNSNIGKNGVVSSGGFSDKTVPTYDMKIKALDDGTIWTRIHHLDVSQDQTFFANASEVSKCIDKSNRYSRMGIVDKYKCGNEYEFMLTYPTIKKTLPSGYTQLEYIEATGTQWINTGVTGHARWEFDIQFTNTTKRQLMGYYGNQDEYWGCQTDGKYGLFAGSTVGVAGGRDTIVHDFQQGAASLWVQNQTFGIGGNATLGSNQYQLFAIMSVTDYTCHAKMYRCKCIQNGSLIRDFIPAMRDSDGYVGLYDVVNNVFYGNSGSGSFVAGGILASQSIDLYNRWIQTSSPTATSVTGFKPIFTSWTAHNSGIRTHGSDCVYNCDSGGTWYAPIGQTAIWEGGIPAADGTMQKQTELWVRTDRLTTNETQLRIYDRFITAADYIEV